MARSQFPAGTSGFAELTLVGPAGVRMEQRDTATPEAGSLRRTSGFAELTLVGPAGVRMEQRDTATNWLWHIA